MNPLRSLLVALTRMPPAVMLLLIVGLAVVVTMAVTGNLSEVQRRAQEREAALKALYEAKSNVVYTLKDIPQGETITADAVQMKQEIASKVPAGAIASSSLVIGRTAKFPISSGQILSDRDLVGTAQATGLESMLKPGFQAVTLTVNNETGVAGFINPGSHVDVYATAGSEAKGKAAAILSDCSVIAVDRDYGQQTGKENVVVGGGGPGGPGGPGSAVAPPQSPNRGGGMDVTQITMQLEPKEIQKLLKAVQATTGGGAPGKVYLTLRGFDDHTQISVLDVGNLFAKPVVAQSFMPPPPPAGSSGPIAPLQQQVDVWSGDHKDTISVPQT